MSVVPSDKQQCRLCLEYTSPIISLINTENNHKNIIENLTSIKIEQNAMLPTGSCEKCLNDIQMITTIRSRIIKSDQILRQQLENEEQLTVIINQDENKKKKKIHKKLIKSKIIKCELCQLEIQIVNYKKHIERHNNNNNNDGTKQICDICGAEAKNSESLRGHIFYMHKSTSKQYKCEDCDRYFRYKYKFNLHLIKMHQNGIKTKQCEKCGKAFYTIRELNKHQNMTHFKLRPYQCNYCLKYFSSTSARNTHLRQHTNERPFKCDICADGFKQRVSLRTHLKSKHAITV